MASTQAIAVFESIYRRTDQQIRDILAAAEGVTEVDTINVLIGDGTNVLTPGVKAAVRVDFRARITGGFIHEFDGTTGSALISIAKAQYAVDAPPSFASIVGGTPLSVTDARYSEDNDLVGWDQYLERGDVLRYTVSLATGFRRLLVCLRIRRLEP